MLFQDWWQVVPPGLEFAICLVYFLVLIRRDSCEQSLDLGRDFDEEDVFDKWYNIEDIFLSRFSYIVCVD